MQSKKSVVLITGAAGGLGKAFTAMARSLPGSDHVVVTDIREEVLWSYEEDPKITPLLMDAGSEASVRNLRDQFHGLGFSVKYIINNAGVHLFYPVSEATEERLDKILKVNTYGPILTVSVFLDDLVANRGRVVQISSDSVRLPTLFQPYPNSKIALEAFSASMRQELKLLGVDLVIIRSGAIQTRLVEEVMSVSAQLPGSRYEKYFREFINQAQKNIGKMVTSDEVADLVKRALITRKPKRIYSLNQNKKISWLSMLPQGWIDRLIVKAVKK